MSTTSTINANVPGPLAAGLSATDRAQFQAAIADINAILLAIGKGPDGVAPNKVLAGPVSGSPGTSSMRLLVPADEPPRSFELTAPVNGFDFTPTPTSVKHVLCLNPAGVLATGTVQAPNNPVADGQEITVSATRTVTALTFAGAAGQNVRGAPTTLVGGSSFTMRYRQSDTAWYVS